MKQYSPLSSDERSSKFFRALASWEKVNAENCIDGPREHYLLGFLTGFDSATDSEENIQAKLNAIFTASQVAGKARPQSGAEAQHFPSSQEMPAGPAFGQSTAGKIGRAHV